ncbi:DUF962 domain-containing protein [Pseudidiomarina sp.]|uniref:Mpo1 family 2-hydroxy fatty acid dioxygenase n=1 Tax=Pseudidiomarina sp. TaxID=2081707 RepID=UPI00299F2A80|nr:Mpo1-like protein [Pseudidiomarina sp.]MDX1705580.1 Mpo1-like protein [Pseudidiomarina sp.]
MKTITEHLAGYAAYHRNRRNIITHIVGVPMIVIAIEILLSRPLFFASLPGTENLTVWISPALIISLFAAAFYARLDLGIGLLMTVLLLLAVWLGGIVAQLDTAAWLGWGIGLFVIGWIIQFIGHYFEGRKPAFVDDLMGLAVGPLFVVTEVLFLLGLKKQLRQDIESRFQHE